MVHVLSGLCESGDVIGLPIRPHDLDMGARPTPEYIIEMLPQEWSSYRRVTVVRNPWDFEVSKVAHWFRYRGSLCRYLCECGHSFDGLSVARQPKRICRRCHKRAALPVARDDPREWLRKNFAETARLFAGSWEDAKDTWNRFKRPGDWGFNEEKPYWWPWTLDAYYFSGDEPIEYDEVLRFESLGEDFPRLGFGELPRLNVSDRELDYRSYYDERAREVVSGLHARVASRFGYSF
jgi:hypothetical protein